jgi:hypothetical protein
LRVSVSYYALAAPGSLHYHRGIMTADCTLHDLRRPRGQQQVWRRDGLNVEYPPEDTRDRQPTERRDIRSGLLNRFAEQLAKAFYRHKERKYDDTDLQ